MTQEFVLIQGATFYFLLLRCFFFSISLNTKTIAIVADAKTIAMETKTITRNNSSKDRTVIKLVRVKSRVLKRKLKSMTFEDWWNLSQMVGVALVAITFTVAAIGFILGYKTRQVNSEKARQTQEEIARLNNETATANERTAKAELALLKLEKSLAHREIPLIVSDDTSNIDPIKPFAGIKPLLNIFLI
jgi:hypothetical protein